MAADRSIIPVSGLRRWIKWIAASVVVGLLATSVLLVVQAAFTPKVTTGRSAPPDESYSLESIDHQPLDTLLGRYVNAAGLVDYARWKSSPADVAALDEYLAVLSKADSKRSGSSEARLAFWINAYNALTIQGVLREYAAPGNPLHALRPGGDNVPPNVRLSIGKTSFSLDQIENDVLRPMHEPQIHFALVCGARGCPRLLNRAYTGSDLRSQLQENAQRFFADPEKLTFDGDSTLRLSPILKWYADDFGKSPTEVMQSVAPHLPDGLRAMLLNNRNLRIGYLDYDGSLNDQAVHAVAPPLSPANEFVPLGEPSAPK